MRNKDLESISRKIISTVENLPYFNVENLKILDVNPNYLNIVLSRLAKRKEIIKW